MVSVATTKFTYLDRVLALFVFGLYIILTLPITLPLLLVIFILRRTAPKTPILPVGARALDHLFVVPRRLLESRASRIDPWLAFERTSWRPFFGTEDEFREYLQRRSRITVNSIADLIRWLSKCGSTALISQAENSAIWDVGSFEHHRAGDCKMKALWAWKKLLELGHDAWLVTGVVDAIDPTAAMPEFGNHVWVLLSPNETPQLLEATATDVTRGLLPLAEVRDRYVPFLAIDKHLTMYTYINYSRNRLR